MMLRQAGELFADLGRLDGHREALVGSEGLLETATSAVEIAPCPLASPAPNRWPVPTKRRAECAASVPRRLVCPFADEDCAWLRRLLQPSRRVHGVSGNDHLPRRAAQRNHYVAGADPNPNLDLDSVAFAKLAVQRLEGGDHVQSGADRALGVILVDGWNTEDSHDRVADVLLDRPAPTLDDPRHSAEVGCQQDLQPLGIELLAKGSGTHKVGEQDRDELSLVGAGTSCLRRNHSVRSLSAPSTGSGVR